MYRQPVDAHTMSCYLWRQALSGDSDGALLTLEQLAEDELPVLSADLLARLYVRAGRVSEARTLWQRIIQADPTYTPAVVALRKLNSPWLIRAIAKRYSMWFGVLMLILFAVYGVGAMFVGNKDPFLWLLGLAVVLAMMGIFLAGLFGWAYITAESLFGFGQGLYGTEIPAGPLNADAPPNQRQG